MLCCFQVFIYLFVSGLSCCTRDLCSIMWDLPRWGSQTLQLWQHRLNHSPVCGILVSWPGTEPESPELESRFLITGLPGKSQSTDYEADRLHLPASLCYTLAVTLHITWPPGLLKCTCVCSVIQSCPTLCNPMDCSPPDSSVHGVFQARIPKWVDVSSSGGSSQPRNQTSVSPLAPALAGGFFTTEPPGKALP